MLPPQLLCQLIVLIVITFGICLLVLQFVARFFQAALGLPLEDLTMRAATSAE